MECLTAKMDGFQKSEQAIEKTRGAANPLEVARYERATCMAKTCRIAKP